MNSVLYSEKYDELSEFVFSIALKLQKRRMLFWIRTVNLI